MADDEPEYVDSNYVSKMLGFTPRTVLGMARRGQLRGAVRVGKEWRFCLAELRAGLAEAEVQRPAPRSAPAQPVSEFRRQLALMEPVFRRVDRISGLSPRERM